MNRSRITGDLVSQNNIFVDIANDRVGIGSTIPGQKLSLPDSAKIALGNSADLEIYHDGSHSYIHDGGTGNLKLRSNNFRLSNADESKISATFVPSGAVELYHNGTKRAETSTQGLLIPNTLGVSFGDAGCKVTGTAGSGASAGLFFMTNSGNKWQITGDGHLLPKTAVGAVNIGSASAEIGDVYIADDKKAYFGSGQDLEIYHNGNHSYISDTGTGNLRLIGNGNVDIMNAEATEYKGRFITNGAVELYHDNVKTFFTTAVGIQVQGGSGGTGQIVISADANEDNADKFKLIVEDNGPFLIQNRAQGVWETNIECNGNGNVELYYNNVKQLETTPLGIKVPDNRRLSAGGDEDLKIYHNGSTNNFIAVTGGQTLTTNSDSLVFKNADNNETYATFTDDGSVDLYYDNAKKLETTAYGIDVTGTTGTDGLAVSGISTFSNSILVADMITHLGDTNTKIRFPAADTITAETGGSERLRISSTGIGVTGNILVSTTGNNQGVSIQATGNDYTSLTGNAARTGADEFLLNIRGQWNGTTVANIILETGSDTTNKDDGVITFRTASAGSPEERVRITSGGNVIVAETMAINRPRIVLSAPDDGTGYRHLFGANLQVNSSGTFTTPTANISGGGWLYQAANALNNHGHMIYMSAPDTNATSSTPLERLRITANGNVLIGNGNVTSQEGDGRLIVYANTRLHPAIKADCIDGGVNRANGFTLLADNYAADESICNFGISYSGAGLVLSRGVKVSNTTDDVYLSSMDSFAVKPAVFKLDDDGSIRILNTDTSATTTTDSVVSLTERFRIRSDGTVRIGGDLYTDTAIMMSLRNRADTGSQIQFHGTGTGTGNSDGARFGYNGSGAQIWNFENTYIRFATNNTERLQIRANGSMIAQTGSLGTTPLLELYNTDGSASTGTVLKLRSNRGQSTKDMPIFEIKDANNDSVFEVENSGRVGIFNASPAYLLDIVNNTSAEGIRLRSTGSTYHDFIFDAARTNANENIGRFVSRWNGNDVSMIAFRSGSDTTNKDNGYIGFFASAAGSSLIERFRCNGGVNGLVMQNDSYIEIPHDERCIVFDEGQKMITSNDGQGNFNMLGGKNHDNQHVSSASGTSGVAQICLSSDGVDGRIDLAVGPRRSAGSSANVIHGLAVSYVGSGLNGLVYTKTASGAASPTSLGGNYPILHRGNCEDGSWNNIAGAGFKVLGDGGSIAITTNDGFGNCNICWNHKDGIPDTSGSSWRIRCDIDGTSSDMNFQTNSSVSSGGGSVSVGSRMVLASNGNLQIDGGYSSSDRRLKTNIQTITGATDKIKALTGKTFKWKDGLEMPPGTKYGFIAQEVESVVPDLVDESRIRGFDKDGNIIQDHYHNKDDIVEWGKGVNDAGVTPILVEALKEAIAKIETLEAKVAALEGS